MPESVTIKPVQSFVILAAIAVTACILISCWMVMNGTALKVAGDYKHETHFVNSAGNTMLIPGRNMG